MGAVLQRLLGKEDKDASSSRLQDLKSNVQMTEHLEEWDELLSKLGTDVDRGLTKDKAKELNAKYGDNKLTPPKTKPKWVKFLEEMTGFFSLLLWGGSLLCFIAYSLQKAEDNLYLGVVLAVVVFVTGCFSFFQNNKADNLMNSFKKLLPPKIICVRDGNPSEVSSEKLVPGDVIKLKGGDLVPADVRIWTCSDNCVVDNSSLTGEAEPQKRKNISTHNEPLETANLAFFGTFVPEGECTGVVVNIGDKTVMGRIASLTLQTGAGPTPINIEIKHFIHIISAIAVVLGVVFFIVGWQLGADWITNLVFLISIIVANVPEGLLATVTVCLTLTAKRMHKKMVLVKNLEGVETLGSTSCICSDKTGTLTQNVMTVAQIIYGDSDTVHMQDAGSSYTKFSKTYDEENAAFKALIRCATLNNTAEFTSKEDEEGNVLPFKQEVRQGDGTTIEQVMWKLSGNASEQGFLKFIQPLQDVEEFQKQNEKVFAIPFNSRNKYQVHVHKQMQYNKEDGSNDGPRVVLMKGAPERVIGRCSHVNLNGNIVPMTKELQDRIEDLQVQLSEGGLRCLGFAELELDEHEYPPDYKYHDGKDDNCSTPNFPLGEFANEQLRKQEEEEAKAAGKKGAALPPHEKSYKGLIFIGIMALIDPPRPAVPGAVEKCKTAGIKVIMVTGDHPVTAQAIAHKVGILWSQTRGEAEALNSRFQRHHGDPGFIDPDLVQAIVVPGSEISVNTSDDEWEGILEHPQIVFARTSPQQKLVIVEKNQQRGYIVAVTGDGVNDSPALKQADIGVAMGIMGSEVSKNAADMILLDDNFASIVAGVEEGRLIFDNLKKSICYTLTSNIPEISPFLCFICFQTPLPLSTVLILGIDLGTDMIPAISMAYEEAEADIMKRPPRNAKTDRLVTKKLIVFAYLQIGMMQASAGFYTWMVVLNDYGFPPHILLGLDTGSTWGRMPMYCKFDGGQYVSPTGDVDLDSDPTIDPPTREYPFWDIGDHGNIIDCDFPIRNVAGGSGTPSGFDKYDQSTYSSTSTSSKSSFSTESIAALESVNYYEYVPWRARQSPFWKDEWLYYTLEDSAGGVETLGGGLGNAVPVIYFTYQPAGLWSLCLANSVLSPTNNEPIWSNWQEKWETRDISSAPNCTTATAELEFSTYKDATFCNGKYWWDYNTGIDRTEYPDYNPDCKEVDASEHQIRWCETCSRECILGDSLDDRGDLGSRTGCANIASRMSQKEALHHAQGAYFVSIVIVQWADLLICKTRWLSLRHQGMRNQTMNFALFFETLLAAWLCYCLPINDGLGTRNLRFTHWFPAIPFSMAIFMYDEVRKYIMRTTSPEKTDEFTGQVTRMKGWLELNTYY